MRVFGYGLLLVLVLVAPCASDELSTDEPPPTTLSVAAQLGTPASLDAVRAAVRRVDRRDTEGAIRLAQALAQCGGHAAAFGLVKFIRHWDKSVQLEALRAAADVGLRDAALLKEVRFVISEDKPDLARAACAALASIGDGEDVPILLELAAKEDVDTRLAAFRALRTLSGQRTPFVHARWSYWWKTAQRRARQDVLASVAYIDSQPEGARVEYHEETLRRQAWILLSDIKTTIGLWLDTPDKQTRARACRLAGSLGLVEFLDPIRSLARYAFSGELEAAAKTALEQLGDAPSE